MDSTRTDTPTHAELVRDLSEQLATAEASFQEVALELDRVGMEDAASDARFGARSARTARLASNLMAPEEASRVLRSELVFAGRWLSLSRRELMGRVPAGREGPVA